MKIYYHYFEEKRLNGWYRLPYKTFLSVKTLKIKLFGLFTIYNYNKKLKKLKKGE